ncbi:hypothetical protein VTI74DRAFT_3266 [Chaetomium olivicolor]
MLQALSVRESTPTHPSRQLLPSRPHPRPTTPRAASTKNPKKKSHFLLPLQHPPLPALIPCPSSPPLLPRSISPRLPPFLDSKSESPTPPPAPPAAYTQPLCLAMSYKIGSAGTPYTAARSHMNERSRSRCQVGSRGRWRWMRDLVVFVLVVWFVLVRC